MFNANEFYYLASQWYKDAANSEAIYRSIIGRCYYAAFLTARESAKITNSSGSVHQAVLCYFKNRNEKLFNQLDRLLNLRQKADYQLSITLSKREAGEALRLAKSILTQLNTLN